MRATVSAIYLYIVNIIGLGIGPSATAIVGDLFFPFETGIRYATVIVSPFGFFAGARLFFASLKHIRKDAG
ncbi:hypothetical protein [Hyphococcus sp.]|uniref:hypothetical protein n=1 Tax=Hyphococcus sp. TaxID=2038636 RepID=UPI003750FAB1